MIVSVSREKRYTTMFTDGKREALCDTIADKGGSDSGFRPHDLLEAAIACCLNISVRMVADKHKIPLREVKVRVSLSKDDPEETICDYDVELQGDLTAEQRHELIEMAKSACPVSKTMSKKISFRRSPAAAALKA